MDNKPHSREKKVGSGSVNVGKGKEYSTSPVGSGQRERRDRQEAGSNRDMQRGNPLSSGLLLLLAGKIFTSLSPRMRRIVLLIIAVIVIMTLLRSCLSVPTSVVPSYQENTSQQTETTTKPELDYNPTQSDNNGASSVVHQGTPREKYYTPKGNGTDSVTIMVYMCGTDLESKYGMATSDLVEMTNASLSDKVNIIVETGGCKKWQNNVVSSTTNQILKVEKGGVSILEDNLGNLTMTDPLTLTSFIKYCSKNYSADRYILIMWDHGGGSVSGYGYDEKHSSSGSMDLAQFNSALKAANVRFDWIGFDACLMQTLETAMVCDNYADYLIASEESEPGAGWYYTNWLTSLSRNTSIDTVTLSKQLIDDFVSTSLRASSQSPVTLSIVDLAELEGTIPQYFSAFADSTNDMLSGNNYRTVSNARANTRQFAEAQRLNQIDLIDFADRIDTQDAKNLVTLLNSCIKYNKTNISRANGISIYFPYENLRSMNSALSTYKQIGFDTNYTQFITNFASMAQSGQLGASTGYSSYGSSSSIDLSDLFGSSSPLGSLLGEYSDSYGNYSSGYSIDPTLIYQLLSGYSGRNVPSEFSWMDVDTVKQNARYVSQNLIDPSRIVASLNSNGKRVVSLTDDEWNLIQTVELNVYVDDGEGYIDLGRDNVFEIEGNDLILDYDNTWLTLNGQVVAYYLESDVAEDDGSWTTTGYIPALLSSEDEDGEAFIQRINLEVVFNKENPYGIITGARPVYVEGETSTVAKGTIALKNGDVLQFLCDYYSYDGEFSSSRYLGEPLTVNGDLVLENLRIRNTTFSVTYLLTDIFGNKYWTPAFEN